MLRARADLGAQMGGKAAQEAGRGGPGRLGQPQPSLSVI